MNLHPIPSPHSTEEAMTEATIHPSAPAAAELRGVVKRYGKVVALDGFDLALEPGKVTALLGPNGAGKTTAVRHLLGLTRPDEGSARVFGGDPLAPANRTRTGVMMQVSNVPATLRVAEHVDLFSSYYPAPLPRGEAIAAAGLQGLEDRPSGKLSGGEKQRLLFALAICGDPDLLLLDEPTVGLDVVSRRGFWQSIRGLVRRGRTVLLTTHYLEEADTLADRIVVLHRGRVAADGTPAQIKARSAARRVRATTAVTAEEAATWPGVEGARKEGSTLDLLTRAAEPVVRQLLGRDPGLADLEVVGAGLEEAFLSLTEEPSPAAAAEAEKGAA
jgi:ABC-2 type transport system ATP-binding protein